MTDLNRISKYGLNNDDLWEIQLRYINLLLSANRRYGHYELIIEKKDYGG